MSVAVGAAADQLVIFFPSLDQFVRLRLSVCLFSSVSAFLPVCISVFLSTCPSVNLSLYLHPYVTTVNCSVYSVFSIFGADPTANSFLLALDDYDLLSSIACPAPSPNVPRSCSVRTSF